MRKVIFGFALLVVLLAVRAPSGYAQTSNATLWEISKDGEIYLTTKPVEFIIVGMGHLYGPDGLLIQLKNKGYKIKQLEN